jgi:hypothetical protein
MYRAQFYGNRAVGGFAGYWIAAAEHPTGKARNAQDAYMWWPRYTPLGDFRGNGE